VKDAEARNIARRHLHENVVVEAGAGTGKTTLLTDRLLFLLLAGGPEKKGIALPRIVALTFTEKAAGEIKVRLSARLNDLVAVLEGRDLPTEERTRKAAGLLEELKTHFGRPPASVRELAEKALHEMDRAEIGTIHHFASRVLRLYPEEAGVDPNFKVDKGEFFDEFFQSEWAAWLDRELGTEAPRAGLWLEVLPLTSLEDIALVARALCRDASEEIPLEISSRVKERIESLSRDVGALAVGQRDPGANSKMPESLAKISQELRILAASYGVKAPLPAERTYRDFSKEKSRKWPKSWTPAAEEALYQEGVAVVMQTSAVAESLVRKVVDLVRPFAGAFRGRYTRKGHVTFDGLLLTARALVRDRPEVREALKARFETILIDEFQDTDPVQGEFLLYLAETAGDSASSWENIRYSPGKIFVVGDPKQSIYRFRGADIRAYKRFTESILAQGGRKCDLQTNFRSLESLIRPVNAVCSAVMREDPKNPGLQHAYLPIYPCPENEEKTLAAGRRGEGKTPEAALELVLTRPGDDGVLSSADSQQMEARWMTRWIQKNCLAAADGPAPRYRLRDVAVLLRTTTPLNVYLDVFKESHIPYVVESDRYFYGTQEVIDFVNLLRVLDDPHDRVSFLGLLRSPLVALDDQDTYRLRFARKPAVPRPTDEGDPEGLDAFTYLQDPPEEAALSAGARARLAAFFDFLRKTRARVGREPLGVFISRLLKESFLLELASVAYHGEQTVSNLQKFGRLAAEAGESRGVTLKEFIEFVVRSMEETAEEGESPLADEHLDAVRLLTIHKAKGLEYPVVFLPNISADVTGGGEGRPPFRMDWGEGVAGFRLVSAKSADIAMAILERDEKVREAAEWVRLFYVALTRAKEKLILLGRAEGGQRSSFGRMLKDAAAWPADDAAEAVFGDGGRFPVWNIRKEREEKIYKKKIRGAPRIVEAKDLAVVWRRRYDEFSRWQDRVLFDSPTRSPHEREKPVFEAGEAFLSENVAALVGEVCHRVLEAWDYRRGGDLPALTRQACRRLRRHHPVSDWDRVEKESQTLLASFLGSPAGKRLAAGEVVGKELPFIFSSDGSIMRGSIDLIYQENGRFWVADYKTDRISPQDIPSRLERYRPQATVYREAVRRATGRECGFQLIFLRQGEIVEVP